MQQIAMVVGLLIGVAGLGLGCDGTQGVTQTSYCPSVILSSPNQQLHMGEQASFLAPSGTLPCSNVTVTAASIRWTNATRSVFSLDSAVGLRAYVTALHPGLGELDFAVAGEASASVGAALFSVLEPPGADSVVTHLRNPTPDSALVAIMDAHGNTLRTQVLRPSDSTCWVVPLSDSLRYSATVYTSPPVSYSFWLSSPLASAHTWNWEMNLGPGAYTLSAVSPDPGVGC